MPVNYSNRLDVLKAFYPSQQAMAKRLSISESYLSRLLSGERNPQRMGSALKAKVNRTYRYLINNYFGFWVVDVTLEYPDGSTEERTIGSKGFDIAGLDRRLEELFDEYLGEQYGGAVVTDVSNPRLVIRRFV